MIRFPTPIGAIAMVLSLPHCSGLIETTTVAASGVSAILLANPFGAAAGGYMQFDVEPKSATPESNGSSGVAAAMAFIVVVAESVTAPYFETLTDMSDLSADDPPPVCLAPSTGRFEVTGRGSFNLSLVHHDMYSAYLVVCKSEGIFSGDVTSTFLNLVPEGELTQHLPIQLAMLPTLYTLMSVVYVTLTMAWIGEMLRLQRHVLPVHFLCLACAFVKTVQSILRAVFFRRLSETGGSEIAALETAVYLFESLFKVVFLLTLLLFSLGWGFIRPSLRSKEGWAVSITIGFYAGVSILHATCSDSNQWCDGVGLIEYAVRSLVMLSTVVAINFNITHIRFCIQLPWTSSSALEYLKLSRYLAYRMTFLAYLLLPTVLLMVNTFILSWKYEWVHRALEELVMFLILVHLGVTFAPLDPWILTRAFDHSLERQDR